MNLKLITKWSSLNHFRKFSDVPFTHKSYKNVTRKPFNNVTETDLNFFRSILEKSRVLTDPNDLLSYNIDFTNSFRGDSPVVLKPKSADEISAILQYCNNKLLAVVPQGGNTGLVGGSVPIFDEVIVSTSLMNKIHFIDELTGNVVTEAGVLLEALENEVSKYNLCVPWDLGSKGTCQIGGNVSTNAGGTRLLRYGSLHANVLGLRVVLPDGEILDFLTSLRKDNTGYDLKHLFIGAEGTLGMITDISIQCPMKSSSVNLGFFGLSSFDNVMSTFQLAKFKLGETLSAFELMDEDCVSLITKQMELKSPLQSTHPFYVLVETSGCHQDHDQEKVNNFLKEALENGLINDGVIAQDLNQMKKIWELRESITISCQRTKGYVYKFDYTVHLKKLRDLVDLIKKEFKSDNLLNVVGFGHIGDGNLHLSIITPTYSQDLKKRLDFYIYSWIKENSGSISAEHGLGIIKSNYLHFSKSLQAIEHMRRVKNLFDPKGIMSPYKYLPE